jgi:hypothetical protein
MAPGFTSAIATKVGASKILGIRAGREHRIIGIWVVVVDGRVFVRSWGHKPDGWHAAFRKNPRGVISVDGREIPVRAVPVRGERHLKGVDRAYAAKYNTPGSLRYVKDMTRGKSRSTTLELIPATSRGASRTGR